MKTYYRQDNMGHAKYTVSYHDGKSKHNDGSPFFDLAIFKNKVKLLAFIKTLISRGYTERRNP